MSAREDFRGRSSRIVSRKPTVARARQEEFVPDRKLVGLIRLALAEDLGTGDVTTEATVPARMRGEAELYAKAAGVFCGAPVAEVVMAAAGRGITCEWLVAEGGRVTPGVLVARFRGPYRALLSGERVALNFLQRLSGIATMTARIVEAAGGESGPAILDTRKTTPLWRVPERYAVRMGGGRNHRFGLSDMVLLKENHIRAAGGIGEAVRRARAHACGLKIGVEARNEAEVAEAMKETPDLILLDNMTPAQVRRITGRYADRRGAPKTEFEISGGVNLRTAARYAAAGADRISIGALTHSAPALDLSLQIAPAPAETAKRGGSR